MKRLEALTVLNDVFGSDPLVITCGASAREMASIARKKTHLPLLDSMGLTTSIGLGIALGHPGRVGIIDGDGSLLMGFSILATLKAYAPKNLIVVVLDNGQHASADQMLSQASVVDIAGAAKGLGLWVAECENANDMKKHIEARFHADSVSMIFVKIEHGNTANIPFYLADPAKLSSDFVESFSS